MALRYPGPLPSLLTDLRAWPSPATTLLLVNPPIRAIIPEISRCACCFGKGPVQEELARQRCCRTAPRALFATPCRLQHRRLSNQVLPAGKLLEIISVKMKQNS